MIKAIRFKNYKVLRDAVLPLGRFNIIVGPNGSGKSTALEAFRAVDNPQMIDFDKVLSVELRHQPDVPVEIEISWDEEDFCQIISAIWEKDKRPAPPNFSEPVAIYPDVNVSQKGQDINNVRRSIREKLNRARVFSFNPRAITRPTKIQPGIELGDDGANLAGILDILHGKDPDKFELLTKELSRWLPEFDRILFDINEQGEKFFMLRSRATKGPIPATDLSHGTLIAIAFLTLS